MLSQHLQAMVRDHIHVGPRKPLTYLPLKTIENVIGITVQEYQSLISKAGNDSIVLDENCCCISSGAVYAFSEKYLDQVLTSNAELLNLLGWPLASRDFIRKIAAEWFDEGHPIRPIIRQAFGDVQT
jgi:hypothetical protein